MTARLRVGMGSAYGVQLVELAKLDDMIPFNPLAVTGAVLKVTKPTPAGAAVAVEWIASLRDQSATSVTAAYVFDASGLDLDCAGVWRVWVQWTVPGQTPGPRSEVSQFNVVAADAV